MGASSDSEYLAALAPQREHATTSSSASGSVLEQQIERSKSHWTQLADPDSNSIQDEVATKIENQKVFETLKLHPTWSNFFWRSDDFAELKVGEKFAEGGQAELYHAQVKWKDPKENEDDLELGVEWVLKVFKKGTLFRDLQAQWPLGLLKYDAEMVERTKLGKPLGKRYHCDVECATLLEDGRFAFLMQREEGDLRSVIDLKMLESGHGCGPFSKEVAILIMYFVALGMDWLHRYNIVHRDLKASNVLVHTLRITGHLGCVVADFECSVGVEGTGFWRAPEILQACKEKNVKKRPELFTRAADAYSYGMTCYEILTGKLPFQDDFVTVELVIQGQRPEVPLFVDGSARELLCWCWQSDPTARPSFGEVLSFLEANSNSDYIRFMAGERMKTDQV